MNNDEFMLILRRKKKRERKAATLNQIYFFTKSPKYAVKLIN